MGGLPASTCRFSAVAAGSVELLSMSRLVPVTLPTSLVMAFTVLTLPRLNTPPTPEPAMAVVAVSSVRAPTTANRVNFLLRRRALRTDIVVAPFLGVKKVGLHPNLLFFWVLLALLLR